MAKQSKGCDAKLQGPEGGSQFPRSGVASFWAIEALYSLQKLGKISYLSFRRVHFRVLCARTKGGTSFGQIHFQSAKRLRFSLAKL